MDGSIRPAYKQNMIKQTKRKDVQSWLKAKGWTQKEWAEKLNIDSMTVYNWIRGAIPHAVYLDRVKERTPDCPLVKGR